MSNKMMIRITTVVVLLAVAVTFAYGAEDSEKITFKGGYTKAVMKEGRQVITLSQGAVVVVGNTVFEADTIELWGTTIVMSAEREISELPIRPTDCLYRLPNCRMTGKKKRLPLKDGSRFRILRMRL